MKTTLITDRCYMCPYAEYCESTYYCVRNSRSEETIIIDKNNNE